MQKSNFATYCEEWVKWRQYLKQDLELRLGSDPPKEQGVRIMGLDIKNGRKWCLRGDTFTRSFPLGSSPGILNTSECEYLTLCCDYCVLVASSLKSVKGCGATELWVGSVCMCSGGGVERDVLKDSQFRWSRVGSRYRSKWSRRGLDTLPVGGPEMLFKHRIDLSMTALRNISW